MTGAVATDDLVEDWTVVGRRWGRICFRVRRWSPDDEAVARRVHPVGDLDGGKVPQPLRMVVPQPLVVGMDGVVGTGGSGGGHE